MGVIWPAEGVVVICMVEALAVFSSTNALVHKTFCDISRLNVLS